MNLQSFSGILIFLLNYYHPTKASYTGTNYQLHSQCQGLEPVYDDQGNLRGHRGICNVNKWDGSMNDVNSMHYIDPNLVSMPPVLGGSIGPTLVAKPEYGKIKFKQPNDIGFFDWLSPHHDIIRNHPHYGQAHAHHRHCIHKKRTGLFDFLGSLFGFGSDSDYKFKYNNYTDPYKSLRKGKRCLASQYYMDSLHQGDYDPYALHLGHHIHSLRRKMTTDPEIKRTLDRYYDKLHRHLDCHCHHELESSKLFNIHHRPIRNHAMHMIAQPDPNMDSLYPFQVRSSMPLDSTMDLEDEHMALLRMSALASQHAHNIGHFNNNLMSPNALQMQMFHPVNQYTDMNSYQTSVDPEWNRLKVEKVIVIKRLKVPVVTKVSVPVPVPVPYPIPAPSATSVDDLGLNRINSPYSKYSTAQPGYLGDNTYLVDGSNSSPAQMNSIVKAISGAPCGCFHDENDMTEYDDYHPQTYNPYMSHYYPQSYQFPSIQDSYVNDMANPMMIAQTMQPGLQLSPAPYLSFNTNPMNWNQPRYNMYNSNNYNPRHRSLLGILNDRVADRVAGGLINQLERTVRPPQQPNPQQIQTQSSQIINPVNQTTQPLVPNLQPLVNQVPVSSQGQAPPQVPIIQQQPQIQQTQ